MSIEKDNKRSIVAQKVNIVSLSISIVLFILFFVMFILCVMPSDYDNLGGKNAWISGSTIKFTNMWLEEGASALHFTNYENFPSIETPELNQREPYVSYPTGETFMVWFAARLTGRNHIDVRFLKIYSTVLFGIEGVFLLVLSYFFFSKIADISEKRKMFLSLAIACIWASFPINNWFLTNIFWTDIAVIFWIMAFLLLEYICDEDITPLWLYRLLLGIKFFVIFAGVLTEYFFWIMVFGAFLLNIIRVLIRTKENILRIVIIKSLPYVIPVAAGLCVFLWQISGVDGWGDKLLYTFFRRTGATHEVDTVPMLLNNMSVSITWGSRLKTATLLLIEFLFILISVWYIIRRSGFKKSIINKSSNIIVLMTVVPIIQIFIFSNHSAIHQYAMTKLSIQVVACLMGLMGLLLLICGKKKIWRFDVSSVAIIGAIIITLFSLGYPARVTGLYYENYKEADYYLAEIIKQQTDYYDVCFSFTYNVPPMPPMDECVSEKLVYIIDDIADAYSLFPNLSQEADLLLIIDKTGIAGNVYDKIEKTKDIEQKEEEAMNSHKIVYEDDKCVIVEL